MLITVNKIDFAMSDVKSRRHLCSRVLSDGEGRGSGRLVLRIRKQTGGRVMATWLVQQHVDREKRLVSLGRYPDCGLVDARALFRSYFAAGIAKGEDIRELYRPYLQHRSGSGSLGELVRTYIDQLKSDGKPSWVQAQALLLTGKGALCKTLPANMPAKDVTTGDVVAWIGQAWRRGARSVAAHQRTVAHACFQYGLVSENDYRTLSVERCIRFHLQSNPVHGIAWDDKSQVPRQRFLTPVELSKFWDWLCANNCAHSVAARLVLIFGCRIQEVTCLNSSQIDLNANLIRWPKTKTGRPHVLPIPTMAMSLIRGQLNGKPGMLFGFSNPRDAVAWIIRKYCKETGAVPFEARDLRRTWRTLSAYAGLRRDDCALIQNHAPAIGSIGWRVYDKSERLSEKRESLDRWTLYLSSLVGRSSVGSVPTTKPSSIGSGNSGGYIDNHDTSMMNPRDGTDKAQSSRPLQAKDWALL